MVIPGELGKKGRHHRQPTSSGALECDEQTPLFPPTCHMLEKRGQEARKVRTWQIICMAILLVATGTVAGKVLEGWHVITSLYVATQIVTTVGYGDFTVNSNEMKLFCSLYVVLLLIFGAFVFNHVFSWVEDHSKNLTRRKLKKFGLVKEGKGSEEQIEEFDDITEFIINTILALLAIAFGTAFYSWLEECTCSYGRSHVDGCVEDTVEQCKATGGYTMDWVEAFYMSVITLTTVGFGDHTPKSRAGRCVAIVWMTIGVGFIAQWFSSLAKLFFEQQIRATMNIDDQVSEDLFHEIDQDGNGFLSRSEFLQYFLLHNNLVSKEDIDLINQHFDKLDTNSTGNVTWEMCQGRM